MGLLCRRPPSGPISTNSLAPTSSKNSRPLGKDPIGRRRSHHGLGVNPSASTGTRQPLSFGGDRCRAERSGGRAHHLGDVRGQPRGAGGFGARHQGLPKDPGSHRGQDRSGPARARDAVGEVGLRKHRPCPPTLETFGLHTASVSRKNPSLHEH
jgi:hypothetical protein